jgi:hypothetical protein
MERQGREGRRHRESERERDSQRKTSSDIQTSRIKKHSGIGVWAGWGHAEILGEWRARAVESGHSLDCVVPPAQHFRSSGKMIMNGVDGWMRRTERTGAGSRQAGREGGCRQGLVRRTDPKAWPTHVCPPPVGVSLNDRT